MMHTSFTAKKVLILGLGLSGRSAAEFLLAQGANVQGVDRDRTLLENHAEILSLKKKGLTTSHESEVSHLEKFDLIIISPGVPTHHFLIQSAQKVNIPIMGEIELGCQVVKNPMVGITGTNGKTTVTLLVTHILNQCSHSAKALGNVGVPLTRELLNIDPQSMIILELSSYQIETLRQPCLDGGVILNITPDHLDRYPSMEAYAKAKCDMEKALKSNAHLYVDENSWRDYSYLFTHQTPRLFGYQCDAYIHTDLTSVYVGGKRAFDLPQALKGKKSHDLENLLAAYAICVERGIPSDAFLRAYATFKKPPHRIEFVTEHQGVRYYDDSKGTNLDAVIRAVQSLEGPIILIAGGMDKGAEYTPWLQVFKNKVKLICAIGQAAGKIRAQLESQIPVNLFGSLEGAVIQAKQLAQKGDIVLLSPGCSSLDMFKDYAHRGQEFQKIIKKFSQMPTSVGEGNK